MKKDFLVVILIVTVVMGGGYLVHRKTNVSYSSGIATKEEVPTVLPGIKLMMESDILSNNYKEEVKKAEYYTIDEVYESLLVEDDEYNPIDSELLAIYNNFYDYFSYDTVFKNRYFEEYTYLEYMNIKNSFNLNKNFGLYIVSNTKCNTYYNVFNDDSYC